LRVGSCELVFSLNAQHALATFQYGLVNSMGFWHYCFGWRKLNIRPGDLVLEVGPGQKPMIRSDVLVDKFLTDDTERGGDWLLTAR
jgi:hypothetical protein